jgi:hypothetical protein
MSGEVEIPQLALDPEFQMRRKLDAGTVKKYENVYKSGKPMPPVKVARVAGVLVLVDGWHRVEALKRLNVSRVDAEVTEATREQALWMAARANLEHGLPLKTNELRDVFRTFIKAKQHVLPRGRLMSYRDIGAELGKPQSTIYAWMKKDFPAIAAKMAGDEAFKGTGGIQDAPRRPSPLQPAMDALDALQAAFQGTSSPEHRGAILKAARELVAAMESSPDWKIDEGDF